MMKLSIIVVLVLSALFLLFFLAGKNARNKNDGRERAIIAAAKSKPFLSIEDEKKKGR